METEALTRRDHYRLLEGHMAADYAFLAIVCLAVMFQYVRGRQWRAAFYYKNLAVGAGSRSALWAVRERVAKMVRYGIR